MADNDNRLGGVVTFTIDNTVYNVRGSFDIQPTLTKVEGVAGLDRVHGFTEVPVVPEMKCDLTTMGNLSLNDLGAIKNSTIQVTLGNGKTYILSNAWCTSQFTINAAEGRFAATFQGMSCTEI